MKVYTTQYSFFLFITAASGTSCNFCLLRNFHKVVNTWHSCQVVIFLQVRLGFREPSLLVFTCLQDCLLFDAWGEWRRGQEFLHHPRMSFDSCAVPTIKRPCAIFWHGGMSIEYSFIQNGDPRFWPEIKEADNFINQDKTASRLILSKMTIQSKNFFLFFFFFLKLVNERWRIKKNVFDLCDPNKRTRTHCCFW